MAMAVVASRGLDGVRAPEVRVEVHLANGLPSFSVVGLAETEVKEARERVRSALVESGLDFPHNKRITVSLAPADLPKESGRFDLPIAVGVLAALGVIAPQRLHGLELAGELSLSGELRPVRGALALALGTRQARPVRTLVLPESSAAEAAQVPGLDVRAARDLAQVVAALRADAACPPGLALPVAAASPPPESSSGPDLADVHGQVAARRALEVAAAGGHSLLLVGPPGAGKSMLAARLPGLLPDLSTEQSLVVAALHELAAGQGSAYLTRRPPLRRPHHSASAVALVGGGSPPRPGEISLAHGGVLFLDELPEFPRGALEALREPLESGCITLSRAARQAVYPAAFQLVAAMNPCPCGWFGAEATGGPTCRCSPQAVSRYQGRISGPVLDRIDIRLEVPSTPADLLLGRRALDESSQSVAARVLVARQLQASRQGRLNAQLDADGIGQWAEPGPAATTLLLSVAARHGWSARGVQKVLRVARTIADLAAADLAPGGLLDAAAVAEAIQYRRGLAGLGA